MNRINEAKYYKELFNELMEENEYIEDRDHNILILEDDEEFRQCYAPTAGRRLLPPFWFVSNRGNLVSVYREDFIQWLKYEEKGSYQFYHFWNREACANKQISKHGLVALVFESDVVGSAKDILERDGIYAFGHADSSDPNVIQVHHKLSVNDHPELYCDPDNLQIMTAELHALIENPPKNDYESIDHMNKIESHFPDIKESSYALVYFPGDRYDRKTLKPISDGEKAIYLYDKNRIKFPTQMMTIYTLKKEQK